MLLHIFASLTPKLLRILRPSYHPSDVADPMWMLGWAALCAKNDASVARLDTTRLNEALPACLPL